MRRQPGWSPIATICALALMCLPSSTAAQERQLTSPAVDPAVAGPCATSVSVAEVLRTPSPSPALFVPDARGMEDRTSEAAHLAKAIPQADSRRGRTFMIAGAAALVGGLLVGDDIGTILAAGGVVLGVYGIILYF